VSNDAGRQGREGAREKLAGFCQVLEEALVIAHKDLDRLILARELMGTNLGETANQSHPGGVVLRKIDPAKNMARLYSLEVERDLLGGVVLVRRLGRIGSAGETRLDEHTGESEALAVLQAAKRRKGYQPRGMPYIN
jgi:predicted DNA-binding WGR domain protein